MAAPNRYKFNDGTELNDDLELNYYETFYRNYDAQIGRITGIDIMAESYYNLNPYHFGNNNPIFYNDPTGALTTAELEGVINTLFSLSDGGSWSTNSIGSQIAGGFANSFGSADEAFGWGAAYMTANEMWGGSARWAGSFSDALDRYGNNGGSSSLTPGMVQGYFNFAWAGTDHNDIWAADATGENSGSFRVGWSYRTGVAENDVGIGASFVTANEMMRMFEGRPGAAEELFNAASTPAGIIVLEAGMVQGVAGYGPRNAAILGSELNGVPKLAGALRGVAYLGVGITFTQTILDVRNDKPKDAAIHGLDTAVGIAAIVCTAAAVGVAAPLVAIGATAYFVSRFFWGPGTDNW